MSDYTSKPYKLKCADCGRRYEPDEVRYVCPDCSEKQESGRALRGVLEVDYDYKRLTESFNRDYLASCAQVGTRRYFPLLPLLDEKYLSPLLIGDTPLYGGNRLGAHLGMNSLFMKDESRNPAGSYKDRASVLVVAKAIEMGAETVCTASTGNAATALACVSASQGVDCAVIVPESAPPAKLAQMLIYGARVFPVRGNYDQAFDLSAVACERFGWYNRNTAFNPYTIDGKRLAAFEIWEQLGQKAPDSVWIATGDGVIIAGVAKGFRDLLGLGLIEKMPRMIAVQATGSAGIVNAFNAGAEEPEPVLGASSVADSIVVEAPKCGILALREIRESGGRALAVSDEEILSTMSMLGRLTGLFVEPSSAAAVAGLVKERRAGRVADDERAVLLLTGTGLKDIDSARKAVNMPESIDPDIQALEKALGGS